MVRCFVAISILFGVSCPPASESGDKGAKTDIRGTIKNARKTD